MVSPHRTPTPLPRALGLLLVLAAGVALVALAAGGGAEEVFEGDANELLRRRPDGVLEERGRLVPDPEEQWGDLGLAGWRLETLRDEAGRVWVETRQPAGVLSLPVVEVHDRTLSLELFLPAPVARAPRRVLVRLNGIEIGAVEPTPEPARFAIEAPAALWTADGPNVLELEAARVEDGPWNLLGLLSLEYGEERGVALDPVAGEARLAPGTGLSYVVEAPGPAQLVVEGAAQGAGRLEVTVAPVDARTGEAGDEHVAARVDAERLAGGARVGLPRLAGELLRVEARWRGEGQARLGRLALVAAERSERPPVVFISIDTFSARHLSLYGYGRPTTPRLEELAQEAVVFERCIANAPWTMPSYLSVMTGLFPSAHRMQLEMNPGKDIPWDSYDSWQIAENRWTMAEVLRGLGYRTAGFVDTHWLLPQFRVDQGFELYDMEAVHVGIDDPRGGIGLIHHNSRRWLDRVAAEGGPFFLFVHALDAHGPYLPGEPWQDRFQEPPPAEGWTMVPAGSDFQTYRAMPYWMARTSHLHGEIPERTALEPVIGRYDETLLKTDEFIGKILDELRARDLYDRALVVISGDHGESFDHEFYSHGAMWEDIVHVPLIVKLPGGEAAGTRVAQSVQLVDLYPTVLDAVGLAPRPWLHGRSLLPLARGADLAPAPLYSEGGHCEQYMVAEGEWKLIVEHPGRESKEQSILTHPRVPRDWLAAHFPELLERPLTPELYLELKARPGFEERMAELRRMLDGPYVELYRPADDPRERNDLAREHPGTRDALLRRLAELRELTERARADAHPVPTLATFDDAALEALHGLGYTEAPSRAH